MSVDKEKSVIAGVVITAGSAIGAGMFSLPVVSSGMWLGLSIVGFVIIWAVSYLSSLMILEVNLLYPRGASFNTMVTDVLGQKWNVIMTASVGFLLYILLYAYFSAFGNMALHTLGWSASDHLAGWTQGILGLVFGGFLALIVWMSTGAVGRISAILVAGMAVSFLISIMGLLGHIKSVNLLESGLSTVEHLPYLWAALPYFITSFGFASIVPSLYKYYGNQTEKIKRSLLSGSLIALVVYVLWMVVTFGIIPRSDFIAIRDAGGNMGVLISAMETKVGEISTNNALNIFSNFAIISSFLGVGLSLFDYVADKFSFANDSKGRFFTACTTFLPAGLASLFFPHGFIAAIGFAGLVLFAGFFLIPFLMVWKVRGQKRSSPFRLGGGRPVLLMILLISGTVAICHILAMMNYLPTFSKLPNTHLV